MEHCKLILPFTPAIPYPQRQSKPITHPPLTHTPNPEHPRPVPHNPCTTPPPPSLPLKNRHNPQPLLDRRPRHTPGHERLPDLKASCAALLRVHEPRVSGQGRLDAGGAPGGIMTELARNLPAETHGREFFPFHSLLSRPVRPSSAQPHPPSQNISPCLEPCQGKPETH